LAERFFINEVTLKSYWRMSKDILNRFLVSVAGNQKILVSHVSLFSAILCCKTGDENAFHVNRKKLMQMSKLKFTANYHKCITDLIILGFIKYLPSYHQKLCTKVALFD
jgi:hypothetical protein